MKNSATGVQSHPRPPQLLLFFQGLMTPLSRDRMPRGPGREEHLSIISELSSYNCVAGPDPG